MSSGTEAVWSDEIYERLRGTGYRHLRGTFYTENEAAGSCETEVNLYKTTWRDVTEDSKGKDTLSSRHVSSCDVTSAVEMWEAI